MLPKSCLILSALLVPLVAASALAENPKAKPADQSPNIYEDAHDSGKKILEKSLGSVGKKVLVTVSSPGKANQEFSAKINNDKTSPDGDNTLLLYPEVTKRIADAIAKAKKDNESSTITVNVRVGEPKKK